MAYSRDDPGNDVITFMETRLVQENGIKSQDGGRKMVEKQQDVSDIMVADVDIFRDTALRYLGKFIVYFERFTYSYSDNLDTV